MDNQIQTFNFKQQQVRTAVKEDGEIYFCLPDVTEVLGISNSNASRFNLNEAGVHFMYISYPSGSKQVTFINEPNLYRIIFRSNKPEAKQFQDWVFEEVLPSIRKTGSYGTTTDQQPTQFPQQVGKIEDTVRGVLLLSQHLNIKGPALEAFLVTTTERIIGVSIPYRPQIEQRTYPATEIGEVLGISANMVGRIANRHNLKTDEYGMMYLSKSEHSDKQVETWRYYDNVINKFKKIIN